MAAAAAQRGAGAPEKERAGRRPGFLLAGFCGCAGRAFMLIGAAARARGAGRRPTPPARPAAVVPRAGRQAPSCSWLMERSHPLILHDHQRAHQRRSSAARRRQNGGGMGGAPAAARRSVGCAAAARWNRQGVTTPAAREGTTSAKKSRAILATGSAAARGGGVCVGKKFPSCQIYIHRARCR